MHGCNRNTQEVEAGRSEIQGQTQVHKKFQASLSYRRSCLQISKETRIFYIQLIPGLTNQLSQRQIIDNFYYLKASWRFEFDSLVSGVSLLRRPQASGVGTKCWSTKHLWNILRYYLFVWDRVSLCSSDWLGTSYVEQADFELKETHLFSVLCAGINGLC